MSRFRVVSGVCNEGDHVNYLHNKVVVEIERSKSGATEYKNEPELTDVISLNIP
jgi:hypothetical protein